VRQLPFLTILLLVFGILAWNFSFYGDFYRVRAAQQPARAEPHASQLHRVEASTIGGDARSPLLVRAGRGLDEDVFGSSAPTGNAPPSRGDVSPPPEPETQVVEHRYESGARKSVGTLVVGRRHGEWTEYWPDGPLLMSGRYEDGDRVGEWSFHHEDGTLRSRGQYVAGLRDGDWRSYHPGGQTLSREGRHDAGDDGERVGLWTKYFRSGAIMERGTYDAGVMQGHWVFYDEKGREGPRSGFYRDGVLLGD
jgi:hypothetical protein